MKLGKGKSMKTSREIIVEMARVAYKNGLFTDAQIEKMAGKSNDTQKRNALRTKEILNYGRTIKGLEHFKELRYAR